MYTLTVSYLSGHRFTYDRLSARDAQAMYDFYLDQSGVRRVSLRKQ